MDNGGDALNLKEVKAFGKREPTGHITKLIFVIKSKHLNACFCLEMGENIFSYL